jgi:hypothetical protein
MSVKNNPTIKNGTIVHASNTAAIKVWNAVAFENLVIDVQGKGDANKTIGGIVLQSGSTTRVGSIKNVTIKGAALNFDRVNFVANKIESQNPGQGVVSVAGTDGKITIVDSYFRSNSTLIIAGYTAAASNDQVIIDMGCRPHTRQYFEHATRYTYLETSSRGHNVPIINGKYQANIPEAYPTTSFENGVFSVDFKVAYDAPEVTKLIRSYTPSEDKIIVTDSFEGVTSLVERLVSYKEPIIENGKITIGKAVITFDSYLATASYEKDIHAKELTPDGEIKVGEDIYLTSIEVKNPKDSFTFTIEVL